MYFMGWMHGIGCTLSLQRTVNLQIIFFDHHLYNPRSGFFLKTTQTTTGTNHHVFLHQKHRHFGGIMKGFDTSICSMVFPVTKLGSLPMVLGCFGLKACILCCSQQNSWCLWMFTPHFYGKSTDVDS